MRTVTPASSPDNEATALVRRAMGEFLEMPGLMLAPAQAARLWALDRCRSEQILDHLVERGFLWKRRDGSYLRASMG
jgi:hypothetical protein